jgi:NAD+ synthase
VNYQFSADKSITLIKRFIVDQLAGSGLDGYVIGLSGGIDSALSASLAASAAGPDKVLAVLMPYRTSSGDSRTDALKLTRQLGIAYREIPITPMIDAYFSKIDPSNKLRAGNKMARERMSILFDIAHETNRLVLGTGNRTEFCLGYTTIYGDAACSVNPIGELYKTEVRILARELGILDSILVKPPTADLWADQTDEGEIGVTYEQIDAILRRIIEAGEKSMAALVHDGFKREQVERVVALLNKNAFKRALPPVASLGRTAVPNRIDLV